MILFNYLDTLPKLDPNCLLNTIMILNMYWDRDENPSHLSGLPALHQRHDMMELNQQSIQDMASTTESLKSN